MTLEMKQELVRQFLASDGFKILKEHLDRLQEQEARALLTKRVEDPNAALVALVQGQEAIRCFRRVQSLTVEDIVIVELGT